MNILTIIGVVLIGLGVIGLIYGGVTYTSSESVIDMGSMHVEVDQKNHIPLSPIAGAAAVIAGVIIILLGRKRPVGGNIF